MKKILFVCHGNICRSPMGQYVLQDMVKFGELDGEILKLFADSNAWEG